MPDLKLGSMLCLALAWLVLLPTPAAAAQAPAQAANAGDGPAAVWLVEAKVKRLFDSHTSYEFGNPFPPYQEPLSRLEFDLDSWWGGVEISRRAALWSLSLEIMRNLTAKVDGQMADSDWTDEESTKVRTIYSESCLDMKPSYAVRAEADFSLAPWLGLPAWLDLRPVGGLRWQRLDLMAHDGTQWALESDGSWSAMALPGDGLRFKQTYWQYFIGLKLDWRPLPARHPGLRLGLRGDWAYVDAHNLDHHLLREGNRLTEEKTRGQAWRAALDLEAPLGGNFFLNLELDYLTIETTGNHRLYNDAIGLDFIVNNGVRVWSQQCGVMLSLRYDF